MPYNTEGIELDYVELFDLSTFKGGELPIALDDWKKETIKSSDEYQRIKSGGTVKAVQEAFGAKVTNIDEAETEVPF